MHYFGLPKSAILTLDMREQNAVSCKSRVVVPNTTLFIFGINPPSNTGS